MSPSYYILIVILLCLSCVDPVVPTYDYAEGILLVDGELTDTPGASRVTLRRNSFTFGTYQTEPVVALAVTSIDDRGGEVQWITGDEPGDYVPPVDFSPRTGYRYFIRIDLQDGSTIESTPETLRPALPLGPLRLQFEQESYYSDARERYIPAFTLVTDLTDPPGEDNLVVFKHRTWTQQPICQTCFNSVYRNGVCVETPASRLVARYDYACNTACWSITQGREVQLFSDARNSGETTPDLPVARIDYTGVGGILAEVAQLSVSRAAYEYFTLLRDLTDGSSGLNAPLPAPLYGNLSNVNDPGEAVLGYFLVSSRSYRRLYWNRDETPGVPLSQPLVPNFEPLLPNPPSAPCDGPQRTSTEPEGWRQ